MPPPTAPTPPLAPRYLSFAEAVRYSSLSEQTIRRLIKSGKLTLYRPSPGRRLLDRDQLDRLVLASAQEADNVEG